MKKFKYEFLTVSKNWVSNDPDVYSYEFINVGFTALLINGSAMITPNPLIPSTFANIQFSENIGNNEKSETKYNVTFVNENNIANKLIIIMKVLVS